MGPREFLVIAVLGFFLVGMPLWSWYRKQKKLSEQDDRRRFGPP
jgi:hypothetical protein